MKTLRIKPKKVIDILKLTSDCYGYSKHFNPT